MYIAHVNDKGEEQSVSAHLNEVSELCCSWAVPPAKELAKTAGLLHDIGKYSERFQKRISGSEQIQVEHSICGAKEAVSLFGKKSPCVPLLQYVIAGHHTGLPDGGCGTETDGATLRARLRRETEDYSAYKAEIKIDAPSDEVFEYIAKGCPEGVRGRREIVERYAFLTKYIFSCLTDADYLDTEQFCQKNIVRGMGGDFSEALRCVDERLAQYKADTPVKKARAALQKQALENFDENADISFLQMPTGSGKTLCSLKLALEHAINTGKKRIIYIIPYTSIIEQAAGIFSDILGDSVEILEHHSNYTFEQTDKLSATTAEKLRKSCENWDAKLIVTTNAQFFQSLYHYKGSRLRKLHNLADSVLVFDEIHMLPVNHLQPCLRGIGYITKFLNSHAILMSATMPDFMPYLNKYADMAVIHELIVDKSGFSSFSNCGYKFLGCMDYRGIAFEASQHENALCVVNTRKAARELYSLVAGKKYHLSTFMTPVHRLEILHKIRSDIAENESVTVVSTSLIEAGVDLDFEAVFRQLSGLDSILQAGGRCNREGLKKNAQVFVFECDDMPEGDLGIRAEIARNLIHEFDNIESEDCVKEYYRRLFYHYNDVIERNSIACFNENSFDSEHSINDIPFRSYAEYFEYINSESIAVVVPHTKEAEELLRQAEYNAAARRKLQRYTISVYPHMLLDLLERGIVCEKSGMFVLCSMQYYNEETGLVTEIDDKLYIC